MLPVVVFTKQIVKHCLKGNLHIMQQWKYYNRWKASLAPGRNTVTDQLPWLTFPAIDFLQTHLPNDAVVFEYGGGGSTLFFLQKAARLITVEHDPEWFQLLQKAISPEKKKYWKGHLLLPEQPVDTTGLDKARPGDYFSGNSAFQKATFKTYSTFIDQFDDASFDVILVDGRARASCFRHAIPKVKRGGVLILDNSERNYYLQHNRQGLQNNFRLLLNKTAAVPYDPFFSTTSIWQKI